MQQLTGPGNQSGSLSVSIPRAGFYSLGIELEAPSVPGGTPTPNVQAQLSGGSYPHRSANVVITAGQPKSSGSAAQVYLEPGDSVAYNVQAVNGASSVVWTANCFVYDGGSDIA